MKQIDEIWLPVVGFEGSYEISSFGRIQSCTRKILTKHGYYIPVKGQALKPKLDKYGYPHIGLCVSRKTKWYTIHRLVAIHYILNPDNKPQVNHIDGNKQNNHMDNLEWCTGRENHEHAAITGLRDNVPRRGEKSNLAKLNQIQVDEIRRDYNKKTCNLECLSNRYGVAVSTISVIINHITWQKK